MSASAPESRRPAAPVTPACDRRPNERCARRVDRESQAWVEALDWIGLRRDEASGRLYALLCREARFEVRRPTAPLTHPFGGGPDDLADDRVLAIAGKLHHFRSDGVFTTTEELSHRREVLIALAVHGVAIQDLASRLKTTPGALQKTLHDARVCLLDA